MKHLSKKVLAVLFTTLITVVSIVNIELTWDVICSLVPNPKQKATIKAVVSKIQKSYADKIQWRTAFVDINGGFCRLSCMRMNNEIVRLNNGMLTRVVASWANTEIQKTAQQVVDFSRSLEAKQIPFLYVNCPDKMDPDGTLLPKGIKFYSNQDSDKLMDVLTKNGVESLDLRPIVARTGKDITQNYFATDHHWNARGALKGMPAIVNKIAGMLNVKGLDTSFLDFSQWDSVMRENWWLGSEGRRVGRFFGGLDDLEVLVPKFETKISRAISRSNQLYVGPFEEAVLNQKYIKKRQDLYKTSAYEVFGGDSPLMNYRNSSAPISKRVLVVKDSYGVPVCAYLSTSVREVDVVDLRYYKESSLMVLIERLSPDMVVMVFNPSTRKGLMNMLGSLKTTSWRGEQVVYEVGQFDIREYVKNDFMFSPLPCALKNGQTYIVNIANVEVLKGESKGFSLALHCPEEKKVETRPIFDLEYANQNGGARWEFRVPDKGKWQILLYAGIAGKTKGISLRYNNVKVTQRLK